MLAWKSCYQIPHCDHVNKQDVKRTDRKALAAQRAYIYSPPTWLQQCPKVVNTHILFYCTTPCAGGMLVLIPVQPSAQHAEQGSP
jgi:hypothetical protein